MKNENGIFTKLDSYFLKLDEVPISSNSMFKTKNDKEKYETKFMYVFNKYSAARYHYRRVKSFLREEPKQNSTPDQWIKQHALKSKSSVRKDAPHYAFELSAFLEALKSATDLLTSACSPHLRGLQSDRISTLMRMVTKRNANGPIFDEVRNNLDWLEKLRTYRHHLVHRLMIRIKSGYETRTASGISKTVRYPVVIPESLPSYIPDTRERRFLTDTDDLQFFTEIEHLTRDNEGRIIQYSFSMYPPNDYVTIDSFMESHLNSFEKFFINLINRLINLDFRVF